MISEPAEQPYAQLPSGKLITFSGTDGSGKSTQAKLLLAAVARKGAKPVYIWARGGHTPMIEFVKDFARAIKRLLKPSRKKAAAEQHTEQAASTAPDDFSSGNKWVNAFYIHLSILELMWLYGVYLRWQRMRGRIIICDRYVPDTLVDFSARFELQNLDSWLFWRLLEQVAPRADIAFLLITPVAVSQQRLDDSNDPLDERPVRPEQRLAHYEALARAGNFHSLDSTLTLNELAQVIDAHVETQLTGK